MKRLAYFAHLAMAETRRSRGTLGFCLVAIAIGVFALTAVRGVLEGLRTSMDGQARSILGADVVLSSNQPLAGETFDGFLRELEASGARTTRVTSFYTMLTRASGVSADGRASQLVRLRAVDGTYPLVGKQQTLPPEQMERLADAPRVLIDPATARDLELTAGGAVSLGKLAATISGEIVKKPGTPSATFSLTPSAFLHAKYLPQTELMKTGSRITYELFAEMPAGFDVEAWQNEHFQAAQAAHIGIQTPKEAAAGVKRFLNQLSRFLTTTGLISLLLGALGIGSAMSAFLRHKLDNAALFRCLGATSREVALIYGLLAAGVGGLGSAIGAVFGGLAPMLIGQLSHSVGGDFLPTELALGPSLSAGLRGFAVGLVTSTVFALIPVWQTAQVAPLRVLRRDVDPGLSRKPWRQILGSALGVLALLLFVLAITAMETGSRKVAIYFSTITFASVGAFILIAHVVTRVARRITPFLPSYHVRQGVANLYRPGNQTRSAMSAIGIGVMLVVVIAVIESSIQRVIDIEDREELPSLFLIDVQVDQKAGIEQLVTNAQASNVRFAPMIGARIAAAKGKPIDISGISADSSQRTWSDRMRTREYFVTFREELLPSEELVDGAFWQGRPVRQEVSIDRQLADTLDLALGDTLTLDIQGLPLDAVVTSTRRIRWQAMVPNAIIVLSPGPIEDAPRMYVASLRLSDQTLRRQLQNKLARQFPNVSAIDVTDAAATVRQLMDTVSKVLNFLALLAVSTGAIIVGGAIAASRFVRVREAALLRVLGASRRDLRRILAVEYGTLALLGSFVGWLLAEAATRPVVSDMFDAPATVPYPLIAVLLAGVVLLNIAIGLALSRGIAKSSPYEVLRG